jgi:predicted SAM-dependent methyltransferase
MANQAPSITMEKPARDGVTRLQIGTSRLELLPESVRNVFLDFSWLHLGEREAHPKRPLNPRTLLKEFSVPHLVRLARERFARTDDPVHPDPDSLYARTNFEGFYFDVDSKLPCADESLNFIFSEHFLEHLFLDEAIALLRECHRMLAPGGVVRVLVPDADLRTYEGPEPVGFPDKKCAYTDPDKHKTRWSVYSLAEAMRVAGFEPIPLVYCDRAGTFVNTHPRSIAERYAGCPDEKMALDMTYVRRMKSLIVDGIKR